jgi:site-specific DNA-methyltransferase (adenine-specific)
MIKNRLYFGDNLGILKHYMDDNSIDLIYLDPPFQSGKDYNILFKDKNGSVSTAQIKAFEDTWQWDNDSEYHYLQFVQSAPKEAADIIKAFREFLQRTDMMAYLIMMAPGLLEMYRVLKPSGTIYLHCDPTASHFLKLLMDSIFGIGNFRNELVWYYRGAGIPKNDFSRRHDIILRYSKTDTYYFNPDPARQPYADATVERFSHYIGNIRKGHDYGRQKLHKLGKHPDDVFTDIQPIAPSARARLGYPTQKPEELLERIILTSSREGDIILDPFCGCGTTVIAAQKLKRKWVGIDITHLAISLIQSRLSQSFGNKCKYDIIGAPADLKGAEELAKRDPFQFEWWALTLAGAMPIDRDRKRGADKGIDGFIYFGDDFPNGKKIKTILLQVKSGHVGVAQIRDLKGVLARENAEIGVFLTLKSPTKPMIVEAAEADFYHSPSWNKDYPRIQILTIEDLFSNKSILYPPTGRTFKKAERIITPDAEQIEFGE